MNRQNPIGSHTRKEANRAMHQTAVPSALLARMLLMQPPRQKQAAAGDRRRSLNIKELSLRFVYFFSY